MTRPHVCHILFSFLPHDTKVYIVVDTHLYSLQFTNCIIPSLSLLLTHPQVFIECCNLSYSLRL